MREAIRSELAAARDTLERTLDSESVLESLERAVELSVAALEGEGRILLAGNGGSAADSQHLAAELVVRLHDERRPLAAIALTTDTSILTAAANDYGAEHLFERQVTALGRRGDVLIAISTSGNSPNILRAADAARAGGLSVIAFTGEGGGRLAERADCAVRVPSRETQHVQEAHIALGHALCLLVERRLTGGR